jgi:hypothetical protein
VLVATTATSGSSADGAAAGTGTGAGWFIRRRARKLTTAGPMTACDDPEFHYRFGVDLFIAGVEAMARQQAG